MGVNLIAALWGLAEATLFFIVPDVWLSTVARDKLRRGLIACLYSLAGALVGGAIMYLWGSQDYNNAIELLEHIPAISNKTINDISVQLNAHGLFAVMIGPLGGWPYKVYAVQAGGHGAGLLVFLLISIPARLIRFVLVTTFCHYALRLLNRFMNRKYNMTVLLIGWVCFYTFYFSVLGF